MITRENLLSLLHAARLDGRHDAARSAAADWLASWPGDLEVRLQLAHAEFEAGAWRAAAEHLTQIIRFDPERIEAYELLARGTRESGDQLRAPIYQACADILRGIAPDVDASPAWAGSTFRALQALESGEPDQAVVAAREALAADPSLALPALVSVKAALQTGDSPRAVSLAQTAHDRWPDCLFFKFVLAEQWMAGSEPGRGVQWMHRAAAEDPLGAVGDRVLGETHPYKPLWPIKLTAELSPAVVAQLDDLQEMGGRTTEPAAVAQKKGDRERGQAPSPSTELAPAEEASDPLPAPEPWESFRGPDASDEEAADSEQLLDIRREFDRLASRLNARTDPLDASGRIPAYIVLSSHTRLVQEFGEDHFRAIDRAAMSLVEAVRRRKGWVAYRFYVDDPTSTRPFDLTPCDPGNAWQIKLRLADFDRALAKRGEMIAAVLIVGGNRIVPFHQLPNPTEDDDEHVPSDNPYATTDENYFAPEWSVGRYPLDRDPDLLAKLIRASAVQHRAATTQRRVTRRIFSWMRNRFGRFLRTQSQAVGYSASIWRKASLAVFRTIGAPRSLVTSPPAAVGAIPGSITRPSNLSYFNLHGLEDEPEWFGQRDPLRDKSSSTEFPIALRPEDVVNGGRAPRVVFTEACYGANSIDKSAEQALSLKFLASGSHAVVGSTKISYGSVGPPLIAADLLGRLFWEQLSSPLPVGEALRRAKLKFATEMHARQGFLDGEDQKTLISFVLYGDPLYLPEVEFSGSIAKWVLPRSERPTQPKTACALGGPDMLDGGSDPFAVARVRSIVAQYLPGMSDAVCHLRKQHAACKRGDHQCPTQHLSAKGIDMAEHETMVVTFAKHLDEAARRHPRFARITIDRAGKVLKLAVSR